MPRLACCSFPEWTGYQVLGQSFAGLSKQCLAAEEGCVEAYRGRQCEKHGVVLFLRNRAKESGAAGFGAFKARLVPPDIA
jgi:hypothetical protein